MEKKCSRCHSAFDCCNEMPGCWCESVKLTNEVLQNLEKEYSNCLCPQCLKAFENREEYVKQGNASEYIPGGN
jgi:hypothetical protein